MDIGAATVAASAIGAFGASITAVIGTRKVHEEVRTNHGKRNGEYVEQIAAWAEYHTQQDAEHFAELRHAMGLPPKPFVTRPLPD